MGAPQITVGVPTFNRSSAVVRLVGALQPVAASGLLNVLVVDDGSTDSTAERLANFDRSTGIRVLQKPKNEGYARAFLTLFDECRTEYLMVTTDDDHVEKERISPLLDFVAEAQPAFVSPQFLRDGLIARGRSSGGSVAPRDLYSASNYAPGLVYSLPRVRHHAIEHVRKAVSDELEIARLYPQVLVVACLMASGQPCLWWERATVVEGDYSPSGLRDKQGRDYADPRSRWGQQVSMLAFLAGLRPGTQSELGSDALEEMFSTVSQGTYFAARSYLDASIPDQGMASRFDRSAFRFLIRSGGRRLKSLFGRVGD